MRRAHDRLTPPHAPWRGSIEHDAEATRADMHAFADRYSSEFAQGAIAANSRRRHPRCRQKQQPAFLVHFAFPIKATLKKTSVAAAQGCAARKSIAQVIGLAEASPNSLRTRDH
jgi:hypothetical protein